MTNLQKDRTKFLILTGIIYLLLSIFLFQKYGIKIVNDSPRYLNYAANIKAQGFYFDPLDFWYFTYVLFVYLHNSIFDSLQAIIVGQYVVGFLAVIALFRATELLTGNSSIALLASFLFMLFPDNIYWHSYILTESIYSSFLCFSFFAVMHYLAKKSFSSLILLVLVISICFFCKPTSPALLIALFTPYMIRIFANPRNRIIKIGGLLVLFASVMLLANQMIRMHHVMLIYGKGDIIFAIHEWPTHPDYELLSVEVPEDLYIPDKESPLIYSMVEFIFNNPLYFMKLFFGKFIAYLSHVRPYWSFVHNLTVILIIWPTYYFGLRAIKKQKLPKYFIAPFIVYFIIHTLIISSTWVDWDARFFVPLFPVLAVLGAIGFYDQLNFKHND